jgi:hypothetical protein
VPAGAGVAMDAARPAARRVAVPAVGARVPAAAAAGRAEQSAQPVQPRPGRPAAGRAVADADRRRAVEGGRADAPGDRRGAGPARAAAVPVARRAAGDVARRGRRPPRDDGGRPRPLRAAGGAFDPPGTGRCDRPVARARRSPAVGRDGRGLLAGPVRRDRRSPAAPARPIRPTVDRRAGAGVPARAGPRPPTRPADRMAGSPGSLRLLVSPAGVGGRGRPPGRCRVGVRRCGGGRHRRPAGVRPGAAGGRRAGGRGGGPPPSRPG